MIFTSWTIILERYWTQEQGSALLTVEITENYSSEKLLDNVRVQGPYKAPIKVQGRKACKETKEWWSCLNKNSRMKLLDASCQWWNCLRGGVYVFSSDLHWSQEWSRWAPKSLKKLKKLKEADPCRKMVLEICETKVPESCDQKNECRNLSPNAFSPVQCYYWRDGRLVRPWSVDSLDGGFRTSQFGPVGRSGN